MPHDGPELIGEAIGEAERKPGRLVAVMTVLVTLAAAATGYLQATALRDHAESAVRADGIVAAESNAGGRCSLPAALGRMT